MATEFALELAYEIKTTPRLRAYDYAIRLSRRGLKCTEQRINRTLEHPMFAQMLRNGMVATHGLAEMHHPRWFLKLPKKIQARVPRKAIEDHVAVIHEGVNDDQAFLLEEMSRRGVSALGHYKRIIAASTLAASIADMARVK